MTSVFQTDGVSSTLTRGSLHLRRVAERARRRVEVSWSGSLMAGRRSYKPDIEGSIPSPTTFVLKLPACGLRTAKTEAQAGSVRYNAGVAKWIEQPSRKQ